MLAEYCCDKITLQIFHLTISWPLSRECFARLAEAFETLALKCACEVLERSLRGVEPFACPINSTAASRATLWCLTRHAAAPIESERSFSFTALQYPEQLNHAPRQCAGPV